MASKLNKEALLGSLNKHSYPRITSSYPISLVMMNSGFISKLL